MLLDMQFPKVNVIVFSDFWREKTKPLMEWLELDAVLPYIVKHTFNL